MKYISFDRVANVYDYSRRVPQELVESMRNSIHKFLHNKFSDPVFRILSVGIGTGRVESSLSLKNIDLFGLDISQLMLEELRKKTITYQPFIAVADANFIPFRKFFHLTILIHLINLVPNYKQVLDEILDISETIVIGEVFGDLYSNPIYINYMEIIQNLGWQKGTRGATRDDYITYLLEKGYTVKTETDEVDVKYKNLEVYDTIKNQSPSNLWNVPKNLHLKAMNKLNSELKTKGINLDDQITAKSYLYLNYFS